MHCVFCYNPTGSTVDRAERREQLASEQPLVFRHYRTGEGTRE
ncbi:MAG: hypothetical protein ACYDAE_13115 [Steroidobacteraceae bacterium]